MIIGGVCGCKEKNERKEESEGNGGGGESCLWRQNGIVWAMAGRDGQRHSRMPKCICFRIRIRMFVVLDFLGLGV